MIICRFHGGLGNQMFQYAAARALVLKHQTQLVADARAFRRYELRSYLIDRYNTVMVDSDDADLNGYVLPPLKRGLPANLIWRLRNRNRLTVFRERSLAWQAEFDSLADNTCLIGYWQSEKYFRHIASQIREELTRPEAIDPVNQQFISDMQTDMSVSLHIRRGDYVSNAKTQRVHGSCSLEYYQKAVAHIAEQVGATPTIYVFSDDPEWTKNHLKLPYEMKFMSHNPVDDPWLDLRLMRSCQHHVVANSSFSCIFITYLQKALLQTPKKVVAMDNSIKKASRSHG